MRAQGLSPSIDSGTGPADLTSGEGAAVFAPVVPYRRAATGARILALLYPVCLAVVDAWTMAAAVSLARPAPDAVLPGAAAVAVVALNAAGGLYRPRRSPSLLADAPPLLVRSLVVGAFTAILPPEGAHDAVAAWLWITAVAGTASLAVRAFVNASVRTYRCRRSRSRSALVVGTGGTAAHLAGILRERGEFGLAVMGQVAAVPPAGHTAEDSAGRLVGHLAGHSAEHLAEPPSVPPVGRSAEHQAEFPSVPSVGRSAEHFAAHLAEHLARLPSGQSASSLARHPSSRLASHTGGHPAGRQTVPVLGETADLPALAERHGVDTLVVVAEDVHPEHLGAVLRVSFGLPCETLLVRPPSDVVPVPAARREYLAGLPCARVDWRLREPAARCAKRLLDLVAGALILLLVAPVLALCAAAVRVEGGPGVLFRQRRVGLGGEEFVLLKFRTLKQVDEHESDTRWTVDDDRIGRVGRFLRATSLDELPQLWNVIRGDMSLVGPRPERPHFVEQFSRTCPGYALRHRVPAGMTGWAQIHGFRGDTSIELRARLDNHYIDHWSFTGDLKILLLTARAMLFRDAA